MTKSSAITFIILALILGLGVGIAAGFRMGLKQGIEEGKIIIKQEEIQRVQEKTQEVVKILNPFEKETVVNPVEKVYENPFEKIKINPFAE